VALVTYKPPVMNVALLIQRLSLVVMVLGKALYTVGTILVAAAVTVRSYPFMVVGRIVAAFGDITTEIAEYKMFSSWFAPSQGFALLVALRHASAKVRSYPHLLHSDIGD
jgi:fucose permease